MVPIENSVEGGVSATLDALATGDPLVVIGEVLVPITFVLCARPGVPLAEVRTVGTHSHAWAQVRGWMAQHLPDAVYVPTLSTAASAAALGAPGAVMFDAGVCAPVAARDEGLEVLADDIGDNKAAVTRFVLVARPGTLPEPTGADKTTVVLFQKEDHAGGLLELLEQFAVRGVNMTRLESRADRFGDGLLLLLHRLRGPRAGRPRRRDPHGPASGVRRRPLPRLLPARRRRPTRARPGTSDADFDQARAWLDELRA